MTMREENKATGFWAGETCEYCGGPLVEKYVTVYRKFKGQYIVFEHVPAGVCQECGTRYYAANVLKLIEESLRGRQKAEREVLVPVFSL
jgi:YgiT-type zinc finger domain-containing protein